MVQYCHQTPHCFTLDVSSTFWTFLPPAPLSRRFLLWTRTEFLLNPATRIPLSSHHLLSVLVSVALELQRKRHSNKRACRRVQNTFLNMSSRPLVGKRRDWHKKLFALLKTVKSHKFACTTAAPPRGDHLVATSYSNTRCRGVRRACRYRELECS